MSMHKKELNPIERAGLEKYGLKTDEPSQLSDCFRLGVGWGIMDTLNARNELEKLSTRFTALMQQNNTLAAENERLSEKLAAMESEEPYGYASLNGEDFSYSKSHTETFVGHGWKPLYEHPPVPADKPAVAVPENLRPLVDKVRHWGVEHTGCEPSISCFHRALDELVEAIDSRAAVAAPRKIDPTLDGGYYDDCYINGWNACVDTILAATPSHSQQSEETKDLKIGLATYCSLTFDKALEVVGGHNKIYERILSITPTEITNQIVREVNADLPSHESEQGK